MICMFSLAVSVSRDRYFAAATCPEVLKSLSEDDLDAQIHEHFLAIVAKKRKSQCMPFLQSRALASESGFCARDKAV